MFKKLKGTLVWALIPEIVTVVFCLVAFVGAFFAKIFGILGCLFLLCFAVWMFFEDYADFKTVIKDVEKE